MLDKKTQRIRLLAAFLFSAVSVSQSIEPSKPDDEEYLVWSAAIERLEVQQENAKLVVLANKVEARNDSSERVKIGVQNDSRNWLPAIGDEGIDDFVKRNKTAVFLNGSFTLSVPYLLKSPKEIGSAHKGTRTSPLGRFHEFYRGSSGSITLSRAGFSRDSTHAYVEMTVDDGYCWRSYRVLLAKQDGGWVVRDDFLASQGIRSPKF